MLALGFAHPAEHAHQHLVRGVAFLELSAQLRDPQINAMGREPWRGQRELVAEPAARALPHHDARPTTAGVLQLGEQLQRQITPLPWNGTRQANVEVLGDYAAPERLDELLGIAQLPR